MKAVKEIVRKYYKYIYEAWTQPILTANGTIGEDSFACNQSSAWNSLYAYKAFANDSNMWHSGDGPLPHWLEWYNPKPLKIMGITLKVGNSSTNPDLPSVYEIQNSSDGINWNTVYSATNTATTVPTTLVVDLSTTENNCAKYWRYVVISVKGRNYGNCSEISLTATQQEIIETTEQDYDFYKDIPIYKVVEENNIYKAPRSWEKGQYYGN